MTIKIGVGSLWLGIPARYLAYGLLALVALAALGKALEFLKAHWPWFVLGAFAYVGLILAAVLIGANREAVAPTAPPPPGIFYHDPLHEPDP